MNEPLSLYERLGGHEGIRKLITQFYDDVRQHESLGPIFNTHVKNWPAHLETITDFWAMQTGGESKYPGGFVRAHAGLGLQPAHFQQWLARWEANNARCLAPQEAGELNARAHELGRRLQAKLQEQSPGPGLRQFSFKPTKPPQP